MKRSEKFAAFLFCGFLFGMLVLYLLLPKEDFSPQEKRYLAESPRFSFQALTSGEWGEEIETYMADHMPGRNFFVGLNAYFDLLSGRQAAGSVRVLGNRLLEAPAVLDADGLKKNMEAIRAFAEAVEQDVDLMIVPSAGWAAGEKDYQDDSIIDAIYAAAPESLRRVDIRPDFAGKPELFYRTDHHWTSAGAYVGYSAYVRSLGLEPMTEDAFTKESCPGFQGSTYSRSALWLTKPEDITLWHGSGDITVVNGEDNTVHNGVFYRERLEEADKYTVFLDGNHSIVRLTNPNASGKLLVIRDSYSNCLGCFLAESFGEVVLADLRYYKAPLSQLAAGEDFDSILICYSIGNFLTDTNIVWLR